MSTCIYCRETKPETAFVKREHVLPESFGGFRDNLTLLNTVCDDCNQHFGDTIERYLARDTPDGLNRFLIGGKPPQEFKSLGKSSTLKHHADDGPLKGARLAHRKGEGALEITPLPQVAFGKVDGGPYEKWYPVDALPTPDELKALVSDGYMYIHLCEITDIEPVLAMLRERGANFSEVTETRPAGYRSTVRVETVARLEMPFGRAISKIAFNYLAYVYGAATALLPAFDYARRFIRHGGKPEEPRIWDVLPLEQGAQPLGHTVAISWNQSSREATGLISFHGTSRYKVALGDMRIIPGKDSAHFFDLKSMAVRRIR